MIGFKVNLVVLMITGCACLSFLTLEPDTWKTTIADKNVPGERIVIYGRVLDAQTKQPLKNINLFIFQADASGIYGKGENRLEGEVISNENGMYEFETIKPGSYPDSKNPAHIHLVITGDNIKKTHAELWFNDDPHLTEEKRKDIDNKKIYLTEPIPGENGKQKGKADILLAAEYL